MKRPSIIADLPLEVKEPAPADTPASPTSAVNKVVKISRPKPVPAEDVVRSSIYLSHAAHDRLREIAFVERKKVHDLIVEGVDAVIAKRGHQESARRKPKAS